MAIAINAMLKALNAFDNKVLTMTIPPLCLRG
jgi:hypothetical protein